VKRIFPDIRAPGKMFRTALFLLALLLMQLAPGLPGPVSAENWQTLKTKYLELRYQDPGDLKQFDRQIRFSEVKTSGVSGFFTGSSKSSGSLTSFEQRLADKLDQLFEKVQLILDMRKPITVKVQLYPDQAALHEAYFKIYKKKRQLRAWYIFEYNTIYLNVQDLSDGMLAHECAHAIVDHYFDARPPRATGEILARYVDAHLFKEAKTY
jgi:hypothetical protein